MIRSYFLLSLLTFLLTACNTEKQPRELFEQQQSGVCMVLNSYYYEIELPNGTVWYCSGIDEDGDLANFTLDRDEVLEHKAMATGTAFFIDDKGTLMTNRHVVSPVVSNDVIKKATSSLLKSLKEYAQYTQLEYAQQYEVLEEEKSKCYYIDYWGNYGIDRQRFYEIETAQQRLASDFNDAQIVVNEITGIDASRIKVRPINEIGIAYNDTYVTKIEDFIGNNPCVVTKISDSEDVDLATIQLKNKETPSDKYIFKIKGRDVIEKPFTEQVADLFGVTKKDNLQVDQDLIIIGFNAGLILGNTKQGIQAQMTSGKVSQLPDGSKVLYSIPTLQGSSGSPVIDRDGYVRAVNFAKLRGTDSFNFGIPEKQIINFLNQ